MTTLLERLARAPFRAWGLVAAGLIMTFLLGQIVAERIALLRDGTEVRLATAPVDPRDIFRGDYVVLTYDISNLTIEQLPGDNDQVSYDRGDEVFVALEPDADGIWRARGISREPETFDDRVFIAGRIDWMTTTRPSSDDEAAPQADGIPCTPCRTINITYGIESYFVPEGEGRALEDMRNDGDVTIIAAVARNGVAAIKGIALNGGDQIYVEPLL